MSCGHSFDAPAKACACPSWCDCKSIRLNGACAPRATAPDPAPTTARAIVVPIEAVPAEIRDPAPTHEELEREALSDPKYLLEKLPDLSTFEMKEILRFKARRYHRATSPPAG